METTLVLLKPDAIQRGLAGEIVSRLEKTGLKIKGMKLMHVSQKLANQHYGEHVGKPFFDGLVSFITSGTDSRDGAGGKRRRGDSQEDYGCDQPRQTRHLGQ